LLELLGEANGPLISDNEVELQVLTQISTGKINWFLRASTWTAVRLWEAGCAPSGARIHLTTN